MGLATSLNKFSKVQDRQTRCSGHKAVRKIRQAKVYSPNREHRDDYARHMSEELGIQVVAFEDPEQAVRGSDIVACCTDAEERVIRGEWCEPGMHITCVKTLEAGEDVFRQLDRFVSYRSDLCEQHWSTPEDRRPSGFGGNYPGYTQHAELVPKRFHLTEVLLDRGLGREDERETNFFESDGTGIQFAAVGYKV